MILSLKSSNMYLYFLAHETKMAKITTYVGTGNNLVTEKNQKKKNQNKCLVSIIFII